MNAPTIGAAPRLALPDVTLCCIDTRSVPQALYAIEQSIQGIDFGQVLFMGPAPQGEQASRIQGMEWVIIPELQGIADYNRVVLYDMVKHVKHSHVLVVQWDGFVSRPDLWRPDFLGVDYIGPPWYHARHPGMVGNGGFSLRSRQLISALATMEIDCSKPEDTSICVDLRAKLETEHGIRFAPLNMAQAFGCEYGPIRPTFGFHGMLHFAHLMGRDTLSAWLDQAPDEILTHKHARKLIKALISVGRFDEALALVKRRSAILGWTRDQLLLYCRVQAHRLR